MRKLILLLAVLLFGSAAFGGQKRFDLKGDTLGMTLATFKARHPKAKCEQLSDAITECNQEDGVSFAGFSGVFRDKSNLRPPLSADFSRGRMTFLSYHVSGVGTYDTIVNVLTKKFGKADPRYVGGWFTANSSLTITKLDGNGFTVDITLRLNDEGTLKGDI